MTAEESPNIPATKAPSSVASSRLESLDAGRGIASIAVLFSHFFDALTTKTMVINTKFFSGGVFGVIAYFVISGFVIPISLERAPSLKSFWINRFYRLYPAYWVAMAFGIVFALTHLNTSAPMEIFRQNFWSNALVNLSMIQMWFWKPNLLPVSWTLNYEMFFYVVCCLLWLTKWKHGAQVILLGLSGFFLGVLSGKYPDIAVNWIETGFQIGSFFVGMTLYRIRKEPESAKWAWVSVVAFWLAASIAWGYCILKLWLPHTWPGVPGSEPPVIYLSWVCGHLMVCVLIFKKFGPIPKWLLYLGTVSYTIYLFHSFGFTLMPRNSSVILRTGVYALWIGIVIPLVYQFVEKPTIKLGRDMAKKYGGSKPSQVTEA